MCKSVRVPTPSRDRRAGLLRRSYLWSPRGGLIDMHRTSRRTRWWSALRRQDGLALPVALSVLVVLGIGAFSVSQFTTLNLHAAARDASVINANSYAEAALNSAYAVIAGANATGKNPAAANLLGCAG